MPTTSRRRYDHRVRQAVVATRNVRLFPELEIPVSTARTWLTRGSSRVVSAANTGPDDVAALHAEVAMLRAKAEMYLAIASVLLVIVRGFGVDLGATRVPDGTDKAKLLRAIKVASRVAVRTAASHPGSDRPVTVALSRLEAKEAGLRTGGPVPLPAEPADAAHGERGADDQGAMSSTPSFGT